MNDVPALLQHAADIVGREEDEPCSAESGDEHRSRAMTLAQVVQEPATPGVGVQGSDQPDPEGAAEAGPLDEERERADDEQPHGIGPTGPGRSWRHDSDSSRPGSLPQRLPGALASTRRGKRGHPIR
ncbi:hypothetical protein GCM10010324_20130 [Streptomyces hiroshimensis]|uniref:Uncharacterized protein n=1 Tax=Streptomyces hiroshimensis TaxID=66424 RepID=A0ABQ2Y9G2_9ACTN|nr:hypothetical protein GCM10010324_20130 [Streptomyces hiroshimensis]